MARAAGESWPNMTDFLILDRLTKRFDGFAAVDDLSLALGQGEILALLGPSGSGKTTTLKLVNRLIEATAGKIEVRGRLARLSDS